MEICDEMTCETHETNHLFNAMVITQTGNLPLIFFYQVASLSSLKYHNNFFEVFFSPDLIPTKFIN